MYNMISSRQYWDTHPQQCPRHSRSGKWQSYLWGKDISPQKDNRITRWPQERHMEEGDKQWTLESPTTTSRMGSRNASIATNTDIWRRNANQRRRNRTHEPVSNATRRGILPRTVKRDRQ